MYYRFVSYNYKRIEESEVNFIDLQNHAQAQLFIEEEWRSSVVVGTNVYFAEGGGIHMNDITTNNVYETGYVDPISKGVSELPVEDQNPGDIDMNLVN